MLKGGKEAAYGLNSEKISYTYVTSLCVPGDSEGDEEETTQDEISSHTSEEDGGVVKVEKELENAEQPVGGNEVVEHEASDKGLLRPGSPLPFSALMPHPQITAPVTQSSDAQFSPHPAVLFYSLITTLMYSFLKLLTSFQTEYLHFKTISWLPGVYS